MSLRRPYENALPKRSPKSPGRKASNAGATTPSKPTCAGCETAVGNGTGAAGVPASFACTAAGDAGHDIPAPTGIRAGIAGKDDVESLTAAADDTGPAATPVCSAPSSCTAPARLMAAGAGAVTEEGLAATAGAVGRGWAN